MNARARLAERQLRPRRGEEEGKEEGERLTQRLVAERGEGGEGPGDEIPGDELASDERIVVHNVICNEGKTQDGVAMGGERLVKEMLSVIRSGAGTAVVTVSIVGNSLGGVYARYAIARLAELCPLAEGSIGGGGGGGGIFYPGRYYPSPL